MSNAVFAAALLDPAQPGPADLCCWNGSDPARRLAVHRNNVVASLVDALADTFEVTQRLVGTDFFRAMAAVFVRRCPPRSPVLACYGEGFAAFVADFEPAAALPYLADVARLEYARQRACHAADAQPLQAAVLTDALARPASLAGLRFGWHPSVQVVASAHAVVSLWAAHQAEGPVPAVAIDHAEQAIVLRDGLEVLVLPVDAGTACFVTASLAGAPFGTAAAQALAADAGFDLGAALARLLHHQALTGLQAGATDQDSP